MELRKDYFLNRWVIIAEGRAQRPEQFIRDTVVKNDSCVLCPGNESKTPIELYRVGVGGKWNVRVIPNKFAAVDPRGDPTIQTHNQYYTFAGDHGEHEVVVETPDHAKDYGDLSVDELKDILKTYRLRIQALYKDSFDKYVCLFKNQGKEAGASIRHAHSQIISLAMVPPVVVEKLEAIKRFPSCPYCDIIQREKNSYRRCFENESFVAFTPYASRFNYEVWILPKKHIRTFEDFDEVHFTDLASLLKTISKKLEDVGFAFNLEWYYSPLDQDLHFHIEVTPRVATWAGFEFGFGVEINTVSPEVAAKFYRGES